MMRKLIGSFLTLIWASVWRLTADEPPEEWVDRDTSHRVIRLSREAGSASLYFHQNAYSADGRLAARLANLSPDHRIAIETVVF